MTRKYNTQHPERNRSHYPERLEARGLTKAPKMTHIDDLRRHQATSNWLGAHPAIAYNLEKLRSH